jgi:lysophospholipase L1-like esterase
VDEVNVALQEALAHAPRVRVADCGARFLDDHGRIVAALLPDGLHPSAPGYGAWFGAPPHRLALWNWALDLRWGGAPVWSS